MNHEPVWQHSRTYRDVWGRVRLVIEGYCLRCGIALVTDTVLEEEE